MTVMKVVPVVVFSLTCVVSADILIRHDRDDRAYRALAEPFTAVARIGRAGAGVLVAPQWVATAAHVGMGFRRELGVSVGSRRFDVADVIAHPDWKETGGPAAADLALIRLSAPVTGVEPVGIYDGNNEAGMSVVFVGHGGTGTGLTGPAAEDGVMRAATNVVDRVDDHWLYFDFDAPATATDLEGISGPGDSGGPALVRQGDSGRWLLAGVSVWGRPGANGRGTYGAQEGYTRVSRYAAWIASVVTRPTSASPARRE